MARLASFWEFRVTAVKSGADSGELAEFEDAVLSRLADLAAEQIQPPARTKSWTSLWSPAWTKHVADSVYCLYETV